MLLYPLNFNDVFLHYLKNKCNRIKGIVPGGTFTVMFVWQDVGREVYSETTLPHPAPGVTLQKNLVLMRLRGAEGKGKRN